MQKVVQTYFDENLSKRMFMTGLVYELEDGTYFVTSQDGFVVSGTSVDKDGLEEILKESDPEQETVE